MSEEPGTYETGTDKFFPKCVLFTEYGEFQLHNSFWTVSDQDGMLMPSDEWEYLCQQVARFHAQFSDTEIQEINEERDRQH